MRCLLSSLPLLLTLAVAPALADPVTRVHDGRTVNGNLELADGRSLKDGVILMLHGTMQHHGQELMQALQERMGERGHSSLAVTLSLGVDGRTGPYDCTVPHRHRHQDAVAELAGWVGWLRDQGAGPITVLGHSRGGNQVARYLAAGAQPGVKKAVLLAPLAGLDPAQSQEALALAGDRPDAEMVTAKRFLSCPDAQVAAGTLRSYHMDDGLFDTVALLPQAKPSVLVLVASQDEIVPDLPARLAAAPVDGVVVQKIDGDHFFRDFAADDAADAIQQFLEGP